MSSSRKDNFCEDAGERRTSLDLEALRRKMLRSLSASPTACLKDEALLESLPVASKLLIESFEKTEQALSSSRHSELDVESRLTLWVDCLEPWHEFFKHVRNVARVPSSSIGNLLELVPEIIRRIFGHCKRSESLYGAKFNDLLPRLTSLFRQSNALLELFCTTLESRVEFDESQLLERLLEKIGELACLTNGMDLKTLLNTWKAFAKLGAVHEALIKKQLTSTKCITRRFADVARDIQTLVHDSFHRDGKGTNQHDERTIKCAVLLLKILGRLCTLYRGYCGNKVSEALVQLLVKLYRYSKITESSSSEALLVPATAELLRCLVDEKEFRKAFFEYESSNLEKRISYHVLTLSILEEVTVEQNSPDLTCWLQEDGNILEVALNNVNDCCENFLLDSPRLSIRFDGEVQRTSVYEATLRLLCRFVARTSGGDFKTVEEVMLRHLLSGELWSSMVCCDLWTFVGSIASPQLCQDHLSFLVQLRENLRTRQGSLEFEILSNLIGRLYKLIPDERREHASRDSSEEASLPVRQRCSSWDLSIDATSDSLALIYQDLRRCPSAKNWTQLTALLRSIGTAARIPEVDDGEGTRLASLRNIWNFDATSISKTEGLSREMLLELTEFLLDSTASSSVEAPNEDRLMASICKSITEMVEHLPTDLRIRINMFLRESSKRRAKESGEESLLAITELFCVLVSDEDPWVRQESFETYAEHLLNGPDAQLFDNISLGVSKLPRVCREMSSYFSNKQIHTFSHYESLQEYLKALAESSSTRFSWHECYEADFSRRDEKMPRIEANDLDKRVDRVCQDLREIAARRNELDNTSIDKLRSILLKLLES